MTGTRRTPTEEQLETRLRASFDRATDRAHGDLADGKMVARAIRHAEGGRARARLAWAGALVALVALGGVALLAGGALRTDPSPAPVLATPTGSGAPIAVSPDPYPSTQPATPVPELSGAESFPPSIDGTPVYAVGGPAEAHIAEATDAAPFYISGWNLPLERNESCGGFPWASLAPGEVFNPCIGHTLYAGPDGGDAVRTLLDVTPDAVLDWTEPRRMEQAFVRRELLRVHLHDPACTIPECATFPVLDQFIMVGTPILNPKVLAATPPPNAISLSQAVAAARPVAEQELRPFGVEPVLLSASFGTAVVLGDTSVDGDPLATWEWVVVFGSSDAIQRVTVWIDGVSGFPSVTESEYDFNRR